MIYKIADIDLQISGVSNWENLQSRSFSSFISHCPPRVKYQVRVRPVPDRPTGKLIFDSKQLWRLYDEGPRRILWIGSRDFIPYLVGNFASNYHGGQIFTTKSTLETGKYLFPLGRPLGELLMTNLLGTGYGIMVHSCGVINNEQGILFAGVSTAGKSTTARLWSGQSGVKVLNDDRIILRKMDGEFRLYSTPWHGQGNIAHAGQAPLKMMFILKQARSNYAIRLSPSQSAAGLLVRSFAPFWDAKAMSFTLQFLEELCQTIPCYELGFVPKKSAVEYVRCLLSN